MSMQNIDFNTNIAFMCIILDIEDCTLCILVTPIDLSSHVCTFFRENSVTDQMKSLIVDVIGGLQ